MIALSIDSTPVAATPEKIAEATGQVTRVSIFGIIIVGLIAGLIVGLMTSPNFTVQGFFLGFAGGSLITVTLYFYSAQKSRSAR